MSERYSRLFTLPNNLYTEDSPVLIVAGALLKDNHTHRVIAQLKFRNISQKVIKSVKVKVNAYDTAKAQLDGIDTFSYLDLSLAANEEFGQNTPIHLPDATTRSFNVEILSVVYTDNEVFIPNNVSVAEAAPKAILEGVQCVEAEKQAAREAIEVEKRNKHSRWIMIFGLASLASVVLSIVFLSAAISAPVGLIIRAYPIRYILSLIAPCLCLIVSFAGKKNSAVIKPVLIVCIVLFALQIASIIIYSIAYLHPSSGLLPFTATLRRYINGVDIGGDIGRYIYFNRNLRHVGILWYIFYSFFAILPNIICVTALTVYNKKMK